MLSPRILIDFGAGNTLTTSALGMGCASLGSRVPRREGLRAVAAAFDAGVTWFDVAPAYGAGQAEAILGDFIAPRRTVVQLCSKVGLAPPRLGPAMRLAFGVARPLLGVARGLRGKLRRAAPTRNVTLDLTGELVAASLDRSLQRLRTDYLDVLALHDAAPEVLARDDVLRALEAAVTSGKVRAIGMASSAAAAQAALALPQLFRVLQLEDNPETEPLVALRARAATPPAFVTHSVFGVDGAKSRLTERLRQRPEVRAAAQAAGYDGRDDQIVADLLLDRALVSNAQGVVLTSMFAPAHLAANAARAARPRRPEAVDLIARLR